MRLLSALWTRGHSPSANRVSLETLAQTTSNGPIGSLRFDTATVDIALPDTNSDAASPASLPCHQHRLIQHSLDAGICWRPRAKRSFTGHGFPWYVIAVWTINRGSQLLSDLMLAVHVEVEPGGDTEVGEPSSAVRATATCYRGRSEIRLWSDRLC
jgi:hypothetical protein